MFSYHYNEEYYRLRFRYCSGCRILWAYASRGVQKPPNPPQNRLIQSVQTRIHQNRAKKI
uniref:Uncharacterized protein n=1 Tax=Rhizophora mucronata TaxID=61149 RepID=A0A2P2QCH1_RHIMU